MSGSKVLVYIYDLSMGLAGQLSPLFLGKRIDGIWHTGIVVFGREYFYGGMGIQYCPPGGTIMGPPHKVEDLGETQIPQEVFQQYLADLSSQFAPDKYDLFHHNCNTFSNEVAQFLTSQPIPSYITDLPKEVLETPFGAQLKPILDRFEGIGGANGTLVASPQDASPVPQLTSSGGMNTSSRSSTEARGSGQFPEMHIQRIVSAGFTRTEAIDELKKCNGDAELALASLLAKAIKF